MPSQNKDRQQQGPACDWGRLLRRRGTRVAKVRWGSGVLENDPERMKWGAENQILKLEQFPVATTDKKKSGGGAFNLLGRAERQYINGPAKTHSGVTIREWRKQQFKDIRSSEHNSLHFFKSGRPHREGERSSQRRRKEEKGRM